MSSRRKHRHVAPRPTAPTPSVSSDTAPLPRAEAGAPVPSSPARVTVVQTKRDYLIQSLLIVFSVLLALALSEIASAVRERRQTDELLANVRAELTRNKIAQQELHAYNLSVLGNIDATLADPEKLRAMVADGEFRLDRIAPQGVLFRYLDDAAWQLARGRNLASKLDLSVWSLLTRIYEDQARTTKVEDEVARIVLGAESRRPENIRQTLLLIRDNYRGWAVDRAPALLKRYDEAISALGSSKSARPR